MKFIIRHGFFETNSSSTHVIVIFRDKEYQKIDEIHAYLTEYGWGPEVLRKYWDRADYFYTACVQNERMDLWEKAKSVLLKSGYVGKIFEYDEPSEGYIDHNTNSLFFIEKICENDENILDYFLNKNSFVIVSNDNKPRSMYHVAKSATVLYYNGSVLNVDNENIEV